MQSFDEVLEVLAGLEAKRAAAEQAQREEERRQEEARKRLAEEEAERQRQELLRLQQEGADKLEQFVFRAFERTGGRPTTADTAAANRISKEHRLPAERAKAVVNKARARWQEDFERRRREEEERRRLEEEKRERQRQETEKKQREAEQRRLAEEEAERHRLAEQQRRELRQQPGKVLVNSLGMKFALIPAGNFRMGSPDNEEGRSPDEAAASLIVEWFRERGSPDNEEGRSPDEGPQHDVEITRPFYLGFCPVTQSQWQRVMGSNPSWFCSSGGGKDKVKGLDTSDFPVEQVNWEDVVAFCKKLSELPEEKHAGRVYRLPTEAEWEYSCRAGASSYQVFAFGNSLSSTQANFDGNNPYGGAAKGPFLKRTSKVGSYEANRFGMYDMHGNVWEWCADWYDENYYRNSPRQDPQGPSRGSRRVDRGGSWVDNGRSCRSAYRSGDVPAHRIISLGFRLALVPSGGGQ